LLFFSALGVVNVREDGDANLGIAAAATPMPIAFKKFRRVLQNTPTFISSCFFFIRLF
jgi:hypothetical protein